jgi:hypothetical protein
MEQQSNNVDLRLAPLVITAYDAKLKEKYSVPFPVISGNAYVTGMYVSKKLYFFVMQTEGTVKRFTINPETGKAEGNSTTMFNVDEPGRVKIFKGSSADSSFNYLLVQNVPRKEKKYTFTGVVLSKSMDVVAKTNYNPDEQKSEMNAFLFLNISVLM